MRLNIMLGVVGHRPLENILKYNNNSMGSPNKLGVGKIFEQLTRVPLVYSALKSTLLHVSE